MDSVNVLSQLSSALKQRDEAPNIALASRIAAANDKKAVAVLIDAVQNKPSAIRQDAIKVLYEIGERNPKLISHYINVILSLLKDKNNRMQWGAMHTLRSITDEVPAAMFEAVPAIVDAANKGSVITRDNAVHILTKLCSIKAYEESIFPLLTEQLLTSPENQLPMYAELIAPVISKNNIPVFVKILNIRIGELEKESRKQRLMKILKRVTG